MMWFFVLQLLFDLGQVCTKVVLTIEPVDEILHSCSVSFISLSFYQEHFYAAQCGSKF